MVDKSRYFIPLTFKVDHSKEIERINIQINYLKGFLNSVKKKLSNHNFTKNAPKSIIEIEEKKKKDTVIKINSLKKELNTFNESK